MDRQRSLTTESNSAKSSTSIRSRNGKTMTSRLDEMREKFHHRLMQEKEQKLVAIYERQQQQALNRIGRTFHHETPVDSSPRIVKTAGGLNGRADLERPRQRAIVGGKHNALEPLNKAPRPSLPRPSVPNIRYNSHVSFPYENVTRGGFASEKGAKVPPARPYLSRHPKLPAVEDRNARRAEKLKVERSERCGVSETDILAEQLAKKQREIFLQLQEKQTALEVIQKQRREADKEVMLNRDMNTASQISVRRQSTSNSRGSMNKSPGSDVQQTEEYVANGGNFEATLQSALGQTDADEPSSVDFVPCSVCGRKFAAERVAKHVSICEKSKKTKRKAFDTVKMRLAGTELVKYRPKKASAAIEKQAGKSNWRAAHGKKWKRSILHTD